MPTETPKAKAAPPPTAAEQVTTTKEEEAVTGAGHKDSSNNNNNRNSGGDGSRGWRSRLMNWRTAGGDSSSSTAENVKDGDATTAPAAAAAAQDGKEETAQEKEGGTLEKGADKAASAAAPPRPMNIWLRRAIERQAESAIAEAIRDGKPIPAAAVAAVAAAEAAAAAAKSAKNSAEATTASTTTTDADATAAAVAPKVVTFADLMRQHREGILAPVAQPPVKTTTVVKKPKTTKVAAEHQSETSAAAAAAAEAPATTPTAKKRKTKTTSESAEGKENTTTATAATTATTGAVHHGVVRKRVKASSSSSTALNSASVKRIQESSAAATPTRTITVKGKVSLEELRARRNRTAGGSAHSTPSTPSGTGDTVVAPKGIAGKDGYNERALDAISQLLLRYCLGNLTPSPVAKTTAESAAPAKTAGNEEEALAATENGAALTTATTSELAFLDQLMEQFETHSLTPASLELLRELLQHVRVLPRPATTAAANFSGTVEKEGEPNTAATSALAATAAETAAVDTEAYREALRRREYVQQVIMVLINQLRQLKLREQQQRQDYETAATAATTAAVVGTESNGNDATGTAAAASAVAPQPVIGHAMPSFKVGGRPLNPLLIGASAPRGNAQQQQQQPQQQPCTLAYDEQTRRVAEIAAGSAAEDETMAAAAFASMMTAYGHMNPYAHLTVFSQHQPVVPPVGWGSFTTSRSPSGSMGARCGCDEPPASTHSSSSQHTHFNSNVAARLMPSPFPGAFPIIPPPPPSFASHGGDDGVTTTTTAKEDREMQELFRMIRRQLTQPVHHGSQGAPVGAAATAYPSAVDVSQAERAILQHVQEDFKKQQQRQQQVSIGSSPAPQAPPSASTPLAASLDASANQAAATSHRSLFTPQGKQQSPRKEVEAEAEQGASPPARSTTVTAAEAAAAAKDDEKPSVTSASASRTLNFEAKPFVPAQAIATVSAAESTPRKTTFNYMAAPFIPGNKASSSSESNCGAATSAAPAPRKSIRFEAMPFVPHSGAAAAAATADNSGTSDIFNSNNTKSSTGAHVANTSSQMNAHAQAFVPASAPQRAVASFSTPTQGSRSHHPAGGARAIAFEDASELVSTAADPWASYEMFARWRDIMESYYQSLFAAQHAAGVSSAFTRPPRRM